MNTLNRFVWIGLATIVASAGSMARAEEVTGVGDQYRLSTMTVQPGFSGNFIKDTTILCPWSFRAEFSGQGWHEFENMDVQKYDFVLSLSPFKELELGADLPLLNLAPSTANPQAFGVGQVSAYAKYRVLHTEMLDLVGGFEYQANSEANNTAVCGTVPGTTCALGFGEAGYNPFASLRVRLGEQVAVGGHVGYEVFSDPLGDVVNWDINSIWTPRPWLALRLEFTGFNQVSGPSQDIISVQPGVDFVFDRLTFRIGGVKGLSDDASDWALGGGVAITFGKKCEVPPPPVVAEAPPPPPPPPVKKRIVLRGVNFDFDKSNIRPVDVPVLEEAVATLKAENLPSVTAIGYTDSIGTEEYNLKLSDRRANSVKNWLVDHGIPAGKITSVGRGEADPVATNETADGRAQNRRVELKVAE